MEIITWLLEVAERFESCKTSKENSKEETMHVPEQLQPFSYEALRILAYVVEKKMSGIDSIFGHEVVAALKHSAESSLLYLQALNELEQHQLLELFPDNDSKMKLQPWCWLQAKIEFGQKLICSNTIIDDSPTFESNEVYLDCVIDYINQVVKKLEQFGQTLCKDDAHSIPEWEPDKQFKLIETRLKQTCVSIPSAEIREKLGLSGWQYLYFIGLLGYSERVIKYDFSDINDVVKLFASGFNIRRQMREHLAGNESPLVKHGLLENAEGLFYTSSRPTSKAIRMINGNKIKGKSYEEIRKFVSTETIFEIEKPRIKNSSLHLQKSEMEIVKTIIHAEKPAGRKIRNVLKKSMPSGFGSPTGTTVLLNGPPGTGKSLTASYIASELKAPVLKIDCTQVLGKYIGESEKSIKRIFDDYKAVSRMLGRRPLLLLNEADQLLGKRLDPRSAIEQSNNNMQNIFLEGLERFDGIMVATTNHKELLDSAYNRRFTFKLELSAPTIETREKLWETHLPDKLMEGTIDLKKLAAYPLTGGEIRLVLEQAVRSAAYLGCTKIAESLLIEIAKRELSVADGKQMNKIGFGV